MSTHHNPFAASHDDEDEESWSTEQVVTKRKEINQSALASSRRSKQRAHEAEMAAAQTLESLAVQGDQLRHAAHSLDNIHRNAASADYQAKELKRLKRFIPWTMSKDKNARKEAVRQEEKRVANLQHEHDEQMRHARRMQSHSQGAHPPSAQPSDRHHRHSRHHDGRPPRPDSQNSSHSERRTRPSRAHMSTSDDELESEMNRNVGAIGNAVRNLAMAAQMMDRELQMQSENISKLRTHTDAAGQKIDRVNTKIKKFN